MNKKIDDKKMREMVDFYAEFKQYDQTIFSSMLRIKNDQGEVRDVGEEQSLEVRTISF